MAETPFDPGAHRLGPTHWFEDLKVGQKVIYSKYAGTEYRIEDEELVIMKESDVHAVIG